MKKLKIKDIILENNLILAPMAGYTDAAMRRLCRDSGAGLTVTEMVSVKGLLYKNKNTADLLIQAPNETPSCVQLFGSDAEVFFEVIKNNPHLEPFDLIDINMGCPVKKIVSCGDGSALLNDPKKAAKIVEFSAKATQKPITVKIRIPQNYYQDKASLDEIIRRLSGSGASMITIHGRTAKMMYSGQADWDAINAAAAKASIPIIGNGDILSGKDIAARNSSALSGLMIGRGAIGNPYIFSSILENCSSEIELDCPFSTHSSVPPSKETANKQHTLGTPPRHSVNQTAKTHIGYMLAYYGEKYTVANIRKHLAYYVKGLPNMRDFKSQINYATTTAALIALIDEYILD